jgi:hypothetical protein
MMCAEAVPVTSALRTTPTDLMKPKTISAPAKARRSAAGTRHSAQRLKVVEEEEDQLRPAVGTLARTKLLLLAALRVWELKNGYRSEIDLGPNRGQDSPF